MAFARASKVIKQLKKKQSKGESILEDKINRMALRNKDLVGDTCQCKGVGQTSCFSFGAVDTLGIQAS